MSAWSELNSYVLKTDVGRTVAIAVCAVSVIVVAIGASSISATATPPLKVELPDLERQFNDNPATGQARYGGRPLRVSAVVSSIDENSVELETVFLLTVTADFTAPPVGVAKGPITVDCANVETVKIGGGYKPKLVGCSAEPQISPARTAKKHPT